MRMTEKDLERVYEALGDLTPLLTDCGALCGAACCAADEEDDTLCGVALLSAEAERLKDVSWAKIEHDPHMDAPMLMCTGPCDRELRPWLCRIFPLCPTDSGKRVRMDTRARPVCPLTRSGLRGLDQDFVRGVARSAKVLCEYDEGAAFLEKWAEIESRFRDLSL